MLLYQESHLLRSEYYKSPYIFLFATVGSTVDSLAPVPVSCWCDCACVRLLNLRLFFFVNIYIYIYIYIIVSLERQYNFYKDTIRICFFFVFGAKAPSGSGTAY